MIGEDWRLQHSLGGYVCVELRNVLSDVTAVHGLVDHCCSFTDLEDLETNVASE